MIALLHYIPTILLFILVLAVLVLVHELGHFIAARLFKIDVEEFGFGFPPRAIGWKKGKTIWSLNWIPLGGFVRIRGEEKHDPHDPGAFGNKPAWVRAIVIVAGVFMNLVLASVLFSATYLIGVPQLVEDLPKSAHLRDINVKVMEVLPGTAADAAGLQPGDDIKTLDGHAYTEISDVQSYVNGKGAQPVHVEIRRGDAAFARDLTPKLDAPSGRYVMGVALAETAVVAYAPPTAILKGFTETGYAIREIVSSVGDLVKNLFSAKKSNVEFAGPVGIAVLTGRVARLGLTTFLQFMALLSVNLAVVNVLPIPALDGGRLLFIIIARLRGHAIRPKVEAALHRITFIILLGLIIIVTLGDLARYQGAILTALKSIFGVS